MMQRLQVVNPNKRKRLDELDNQNISGPVESDTQSVLSLDDSESGDSISAIAAGVKKIIARNAVEIPCHDPETGTDIVDIKTKRKRSGNIRKGIHYITKYDDPYIPDATDRSKYDMLYYIFIKYTKSRSHVGNIGEILDFNRVKFLWKNFDFVSSWYLKSYGFSLLDLGLTLDELYHVYTVTFDPAWLGHNKIISEKYLNVWYNAENTWTGPLFGPRFLNYVKGVSTFKCKIYCLILNKTDFDYNNLMNKINLDIPNPSDLINKTDFLVLNASDFWTVTEVISNAISAIG